MAGSSYPLLPLHPAPVVPTMEEQDEREASDMREAWEILNGTSKVPEDIAETMHLEREHCLYQINVLRGAIALTVNSYMLSGRTEELLAKAEVYRRRIIEIDILLEGGYGRR